MPSRQRLFSFSPLVLYTLAVLLVRPCSAAITSDQLPAMTGTTFAVEVEYQDDSGNTTPRAVILNIQSNHLTLSIYDPATSRTTSLHGAAVNVVTSGQSWNVLNPDGGLIGNVFKNSSGMLSTSSGPTYLGYIPPGQTTTLGISPVWMVIACCISFELTGAKGSCCCCCVGSHRAVGIPPEFDCICCFYLNGDSCCGH